MEICTVVTRDREEMVDITERLCAVIREKGWRHGVAALFCPHTTCGLTINEGADPDVRRDMTAFFSRIIPHRGECRRRFGLRLLLQPALRRLLLRMHGRRSYPVLLRIDLDMKQEMKNAKIQMKQLNLMLEENQAFMYSIWKKQKISKQEKILIIKM